MGRPAPGVPAAAAALPDTDDLAADVESIPDAATDAGALPAPSLPAAQLGEEMTVTTASDAEESAGTPAGGASASSSQVDELARKLFDPLMLRLRAELLVERERRGLRTDPW